MQISKSSISTPFYEGSCACNVPCAVTADPENLNTLFASWSELEQG